jgi:hypothetical protein
MPSVSLLLVGQENLCVKVTCQWLGSGIFSSSVAVCHRLCHRLGPCIFSKLVEGHLNIDFLS